MKIITGGSPLHSDGVMHKLMSMVESELPCLLLNRVEDLQFNEEVLQLDGKDFIVCDVIENGWNVRLADTVIVGYNTDTLFKTDGWLRLDSFLRQNKPKKYLKRELLAKNVTDVIVPVEYPNWQPDYLLQSREEFENRPISAFNYWGRSHEARLMLQGEMWKHAVKNGYSVCDNIYQFNEFMYHEKEAKKLVSFHMPFYSRVDITALMKINKMSKLSISLPGCGIKCFRSTGESIVDSVVVLPEDNLSYSKRFIHGVNCVKFYAHDVTGLEDEWDVMGAVEAALSKKVLTADYLEVADLYNIYVEGKKLADWYRADNYIKNYLEPLINSEL